MSRSKFKRTAQLRPVDPFVTMSQSEYKKYKSIRQNTKRRQSRVKHVVSPTTKHEWEETLGYKLDEYKDPLRRSKRVKKQGFTPSNPSQNNEADDSDEYDDEHMFEDSEDDDIEPDTNSLEVPNELLKTKTRVSNIGVRAIRMLYNTEQDALVVRPNTHHEYGFGEYIFTPPRGNQPVPTNFPYTYSLQTMMLPDTLIHEPEIRLHDVPTPDKDTLELNSESTYKLVVREKNPSQRDGFTRSDTFYIMYNPSRFNKDTVELWKEFYENWLEAFNKDKKQMKDYLLKNSQNFYDQYKEQLEFEKDTIEKVKKEGGIPYKRSWEKRENDLIMNFMPLINKLHLVYVFDDNVKPCDFFLDILYSYVPSVHIVTLNDITKMERKKKKRINLDREQQRRQRNNKV
ncbi:MAG: hypothetical protein ACTSUE_00680 [Promethearchaeota archaeon]